MGLLLGEQPLSRLASNLRALQVHHGLVQCKHHGRFDKVSMSPKVSVGAIQALRQSELRRHYSKDQQTRLDPNVTRNDVQQCNVATMPVDEDEPAEPGRSHGAPEVTTDTKQCVCGKRHCSHKAQMLNRPPIAQSGKDPNYHSDIRDRLRKSAAEIDQPVGAFLKDLKQRGLLDSTLVIWGGEFGRKPTRDGNGNENPGRDHNNGGFCAWMAGGGVKGGTIYGATDEFGVKAVKDPVHVHDLHATILALLGFDHTKLTYRYNGRDFRLTDVAGEVVKGVIA